MEQSLTHDRRRADRRDGDTPPDALVERLARELPDAMARGEIAILFQPQVRVADDRIDGAEALARWDHPALGALGADLLFAAAERSGLERALGPHIQEAALAAAAAWPAALAGLSMALNVTAGDLAERDFAPALLDRVARSGFPASRLTVEVTEAAPIADLPAAAAALEQVRAAGVRVAIDDFGSGYASFAWLKALPLDRLKIDRSLVADIAVSAHARALVRGIVALAGALGLDVVAEGVETEAQRAVLVEEGSGWLQGFLCSAALGTPALAELVEHRRRT